MQNEEPLEIKDTGEPEEIIKEESSSKEQEKENNKGFNSKNLYSDARSCAVKILCRIERTDAYLDKVLDSELKILTLNDYDKALLSELTHGVLRWLRRLDWFLNGFYRGQYEKCLPEVKNAMRVALYQILFLNKIPYAAAVNEAVEFVKKIRGEKHAGVVNGLLRTIIRTLENLVWPTRDIDEVNYLGIIQSHPNWLVRRWINRFGFDEAEKLCEANNRRPILCLRVNKLKTSKEELLNHLREKNISYRPVGFLDYFFTIKLMSKIYKDELFRAGYFTIQDISAGLISHLVNPIENELILDICAAPGGKSSHMSELMKNRGKIISVDKYLSRTEIMRSNFERLGVQNAQIIHDDISNPSSDLLKSELLGKADKILVDAPCSGLGVLSKKPDIKWKRAVEDISKLQKLQLSLLDSSVKYLKQGGSIIYSTCTVEYDENYAVVKNFLENHTDFILQDAKEFVNSRVVNSYGCLETFPNIHYCDGSFGAVLKHKT
jgi:16S rRNA (cytosine967-C5)-methyltransferase